MKYGILLYVKVILIYFLGLFLKPKPKKREIRTGPFRWVRDEDV